MATQTKFNKRKHNSTEVLEKTIHLHGTDVNFATQLKFDHNKGSFKILPQISFHHYSGNKTELKAFLKLVTEAVSQGFEDCIAWKNKWNEENPDDPDQLPMGFGEGEDD